MNRITERPSTILVYRLDTVVKYLAQNLNDNYPRKEIMLFLKTVQFQRLWQETCGNKCPVN